MIRELLSDHKELSFKIVCADRLSAAKPFFAEGGIDIIILDLGLPDSQGLDTIRRVREHAVEVPIVVLTMLDNEETGLNALKEGAQDYLFKGHMNGAINCPFPALCDRTEQDCNLFLFRTISFNKKFYKIHN